MESHTRSVTKAVSWKVLVILTDFSLLYFLTDEFNFAVGYAIGKNALTFIMYYGHERVWNKVGWGKESDKGDLTFS